MFWTNSLMTNNATCIMLSKIVLVLLAKLSTQQAKRDLVGVSIVAGLQTYFLNFSWIDLSSFAVKPPTFNLTSFRGFTKAKHRFQPKQTLLYNLQLLWFAHLLYLYLVSSNLKRGSTFFVFDFVVYDCIRRSGISMPPFT